MVEEVLGFETPQSDLSGESIEFESASICCDDEQFESVRVENQNVVTNVESSKIKDETSGRGRGRSCGGGGKDSNNSYAANKNVAEGLMDIALLSANANQLRFLITYNRQASTYYISLGLIALSLTLQVAVGIGIIFRRRFKRCQSKRFTRTNEFLVGGVFMVTVVNILLAAFTTTDGSTQ